MAPIAIHISELQVASWLANLLAIYLAKTKWLLHEFAQHSINDMSDQRSIFMTYSYASSYASIIIH